MGRGGGVGDARGGGLIVNLGHAMAKKKGNSYSAKEHCSFLLFGACNHSRELMFQWHYKKEGTEALFFVVTALP